jgi:hypothetical protein
MWVCVAKAVSVDQRTMSHMLLAVLSQLSAVVSQHGPIMSQPVLCSRWLLWSWSSPGPNLVPCERGMLLGRVVTEGHKSTVMLWPTYTSDSI